MLYVFINTVYISFLRETHGSKLFPIQLISWMHCAQMPHKLYHHPQAASHLKMEPHTTGVQAEDPPHPRALSLIHCML